MFPAGLADGGGVLRLPRGQPRGGQAGARRVLGVGRGVHAEEQDEDRPAAPLPTPHERSRGRSSRVCGDGWSLGVGPRGAAADPQHGVPLEGAEDTRGTNNKMGSKIYHVFTVM